MRLLKMSLKGLCFEFYLDLWNGTMIVCEPFFFEFWCYFAASTIPPASRIITLPPPIVVVFHPYTPQHSQQKHRQVFPFSRHQSPTPAATQATVVDLF